MFCSQCGAQVPENAQFCGKCGARIGGGQSVPDENAGQVPSLSSVGEQKTPEVKVQSFFDNNDNRLAFEWGALLLMIAGFFLPFAQNICGESVKLSGLLMDGNTEVILFLILLFGSAMVGGYFENSDSLHMLGVGIPVIGQLVCLYLIATLPDKVVPDVTRVLAAEGGYAELGFYAELIGIILYIIWYLVDYYRKRKNKKKNSG